MYQQTRETNIGRKWPRSALVVDDHWLVRSTLAQIVASLCPEAAICEAADYAELSMVMSAMSPELLLLDLRMPGLTNWRTEAPALIASMHRTCVVVVSALDDRPLLQRLFTAGIAGFVPKSYSRQKIIDALRFVINGGTYVPVGLLTDPVGARGTLSACLPNGSSLTPRQLDVLDLIGEGLSNRDIARRLRLSEATVKAHVSALLKSLGFTNRTEAALAARQFSAGGTVCPSVGRSPSCSSIRR